MGQRIDPMNILLIITDQMRADSLGMAGNRSARTPHLDKFAATGAISERMYCAHPLCMPSRSSIITGATPAAHRVWSNGVALDPQIPVIGDQLSESGYSTCLIGKAHFRPYGFEDGESDTDTGAVEVEYEDNWINGSIPDDWNGPYYGFDEAYLTLRHNDVRGGHAGRDIEAAHPGAWKMTDSDHALEQNEWIGAWKSGLPIDCHASEWITEKSIQYMTRDKEAPFFLTASFPDPHHPFAPSEPFASLINPDEIELPASHGASVDSKPPHVRDYLHGKIDKHEGWGAGADDLPSISERSWKEILAYYYGTVAHIDDCVGRILEALDDLGLSDKTAVFFTSDHGELLGDHGLLYKGPFPYEGLYRVPFIARVPGVTQPGSRLPDLGSHIDFAPTFADLAGQNALPSYQGASMLPWLAGGDGREIVNIEFISRYFPDLESATVISERWKLIHYSEAPFGELYDLEADPMEMNNLWDEPAVSDIRHRLETRALDDALKTRQRLPWPTSHA